MLIILEKLLVSFVIVYSIYMIYFYFRNKSKKKKNSLIEVQYLKNNEVIHCEIGECIKEKYSKNIELYVRDSNIDNKWCFGIIL